MSQVNIIICPKCGTENPSDATNCKQCRVNLEYALEHPEEFGHLLAGKQETTSKAVQPMTKMEVATEIGRLEGELSKLESELREQERQFNSAKGNRTAGASALLIGILGTLFFAPLLMLWVFLGLIGLLTLLTAIIKENGAKERMQTKEKTIADTRARLAEHRAQLSVP